MPTPLDVRIRVATESDLGQIADCLSAAFEPYRHRYPPQAYAHTVLRGPALAARLAEMTILVAIDGRGVVLGTVALSIADGRHGIVRGMAVHPRYARQSVGHALLDHAVAELRRRNCVDVSLGTVDPLERAIYFYEQYGFKRTGRTEDFYGMVLHEFTLTLPKSPSREATDASS